MQKKAILMICVLCGLLVIIGCGQDARKPAPDTSPNSGVQQTSDAEKRVMANRFSNLAMEIDGVQKATVVVASRPDMNAGGVDPFSGLPNTGTQVDPAGVDTNPEAGNLVVMTGINLSPTVSQDTNKVNSIKEQVKTKIKADNSNVSEVLVTTNPDLIKKLQDVAAGIIQGQPVQSYTQDINELDRNLRAQKNS